MTGEYPQRKSQYLALAEWWYNTNYHTSVKATPFQLLYGYLPPLHLPYIPRDSANAVVNSLLRIKEDMLKMLKVHLKRAQHRMSQNANKRRSE